MSKDFYAILGVSKTATADEIKKSFRRLAHEHHPDKGGDAKKFKDINEAYQVLSDAKKRAAYDQFGSAAFDGNGGGPGAGGFGGGFQGFDFNGGFDPSEFGDLGDVLGQMFGMGGARGGRGGGKPRGEDIQVDVYLTFREAAFGVSKSVQVYHHVACAHCKGEGGEPGTKRTSCATCKGSGQAREARRTVFGVMQTVVTCSACHGVGTIPEKPCTTCRGQGVERKQETLTIPIPPGIAEGETLKVSGQGERVPHGGAGDLYIELHVEKDKLFSREHQDVLSTVHVPFSTLALGGVIKVETLDGIEDVRIDAGTPVGTVVTIRGKGIAHHRSSTRGAHRATLHVETPKKLTREQRDHMEALQKLGL